MSLEVVTKQIVDKEKEARRRVMERGKVHFEDGIWRALWYP